MKFPLRLKVDSWCFLELPDDVAEWELYGYELHYRNHYPAVFNSRSGKTLFFEFPHRIMRDRFLIELEKGFKAQGLLTNPQTIYPD